MSDTTNQNDTATAAAGIDTSQLNRYASDAFKKSAEAMSRADVGKTQKIFGLFEVDAGIADAIYGLYNLGADYATHYIVPHTRDLAKLVAARAGLDEKSQNAAAAITSFAVVGGIKSAAYLPPLLKSHGDYKAERVKLVREIAPVLNELKGRHSVGALYAVKEADNEVIYAHRKRMEKISHNTNFGHMLDIAANSGVNLMLDIKMLAKVWQGKPLTASDFAKNQSKDEVKKETEKLSHIDNPGDMKQLFRNALVTIVPSIAGRVKKSNDQKLKDSLQPYTALEMIVELEKQVATNPKARSFVMPKSIRNPKSRPEECPLEQYLMQICIQHQKEMSDISDEHTEIREALKDDLLAAVKPIAEGIRKGDLNALSLIRLVGEGKIIKNRGRSIAEADDVKDLIDHLAPKQSGFLHKKSSDYYKGAAFTHEELKVAIKSLDKEERRHFVTSIPDSVLRELGVSDHDIKSMREATANDYHHKLAEQVAGIYVVDLKTKSDEELKKEGHSKSEIETLRAAFKKVEKQGDEAIHDLKSGPGHENGIEQALTNWAVPRIKEDKAYFGTVIEKGRQKLEALADDQAEHDEKTAAKAQDKKPSHHEEEADAVDAPDSDTPHEKHTGKLVHMAKHGGKLATMDHHKAQTA